MHINSVYDEYRASSYHTKHLIHYAYILILLHIYFTICLILFRLNLVFCILVLHGIGALMPWNMFITAKEVSHGIISTVNTVTFIYFSYFKR